MEGRESYDTDADEICGDYGAGRYHQRGGKAALYFAAQPDCCDPEVGAGVGHHDFDRSNKGVGLTPEGEVFLGYAVQGKTVKTNGL